MAEFKRIIPDEQVEISMLAIVKNLSNNYEPVYANITELNELAGKVFDNWLKGVYMAEVIAQKRKEFDAGLQVTELDIK